MREIKFRAWNGKYMVEPEYGDWVSFDGVPYTEPDKRYDTPHIEIEKAKGYILMQFTGLLDKNGKEIYEGDIVKWIESGGMEADYTHITEVKYVDAGFMPMMDIFKPEALFDSHERGGTLIEICRKWNWDDYWKIEVIGNIYENGDLLK